MKRQLFSSKSDEKFLNPVSSLPSIDWLVYLSRYLSHLLTNSIFTVCSHHIFTCCINWEQAWVIKLTIVGLQLSGSNSAADGKFDLEDCRTGFEYKSDRKVSWSVVNWIVSIETFSRMAGWFWARLNENSSMRRGEPDIKVLWRNPYSENQRISLKTGWEPTNNPMI